MNKDIVSTENAPGAIGPYSQAIKAGGMVYCSGQIPIDPATGAFKSQSTVGAGVSLPPVVANSTLYIFDDRGRLIAYR